MKWKEAAREGGRKRKCSAYLADTDTHINGTDCAHPIAPTSYLNYIYMALTTCNPPIPPFSPHLHLNHHLHLQRHRHLWLCQRCRRLHPRTRTQSRQPVLSALRQWQRMRESESDSDYARERQRCRFIHKNLSRSLCCILFFFFFLLLCQAGWVCLPHRCSYSNG